MKNLVSLTKQVAEKQHSNSKDLKGAWKNWLLWSVVMAFVDLEKNSSL
jgi:hypothetical protein